VLFFNVSPITSIYTLSLTTLFRSLEVIIEVLSRDGAALKPGTPVEFDQWGGPEPLKGIVRHVEPAAFTKVSALGVEEQRVWVVRSEEHTSELQSLRHLVCRLLLEK